MQTLIIIISMYIGFFFTKGWLEQLSNFLIDWRYELPNKELRLISERLKNIENKLEGKHD